MTKRHNTWRREAAGFHVSDTGYVLTAANRPTGRVWMVIGPDSEDLGAAATLREGRMKAAAHRWAATMQPVDDETVEAMLRGEHPAQSRRLLR